MACETIRYSDGMSVTICNRRQRRSRKLCTVVGCRNPATILCDFPLAGEAEGRTCSKALCRAHAVKQVDVTPFPRMVDVRLVPGGELHRVLLPGEEGETVDFCPAHDKLVVRKETANG